MTADERGQTTLDFALGVGLFLIAVVFVIGFIPGMFEPFAGDQNLSPVADRAANHAATDLLGIGVDPYRLNTSCTAAFFDGTTPEYCQFDTTDLNDALGIGNRLRLNLTIENSTGVVVLDPAGTPTTLATGDAPPNRHRSVSVAQRAVYLDGETNRLILRVWD